MAEREFFVICSNCGSEVSPYVTECPYCGKRLRKSAPDLKKQKKADEKEERKAEKRRERLKAQYEGGASAAPGAWLETSSRPIATISLVTIAVVSSILAASEIPHVSGWMLSNLVYNPFVHEFSSTPTVLLTAPFIHLSAGYAFVCLMGFAIFGAGVERRFGAWAVVALWFFTGALGVGLKVLVDPTHGALGAMACVAGALFAWTLYVVNKEDLRDYDGLGLAAIAFVVCALPLATDAASVWMLMGGAIAGLIFGFVLTRLPAR
jgi:membrane associated rhomboid family serine protease